MDYKYLLFVLISGNLIAMEKTNATLPKSLTYLSVLPRHLLTGQIIPYMNSSDITDILNFLKILPVTRKSKKLILENKRKETWETQLENVVAASYLKKAVKKCKLFNYYPTSFKLKLIKTFATHWHKNFIDAASIIKFKNSNLIFYEYIHEKQGDIVAYSSDSAYKKKSIAEAIITACQHATDEQHTVLRFLAKNSGCVALYSHQSYSAIGAAILFNNLNAVKLLIPTYVNTEMLIEAKGGTSPWYASLTPLLFSASLGYYEIVEYLLEKGATITAVDAENNTALMLAINNNTAPSMDLVQTLIRYKIPLEQRNFQRQTARDIAVLKNHHHIVAILDKASTKNSMSTE